MGISLIFFSIGDTSIKDFLYTGLKSLIVGSDIPIDSSFINRKSGNAEISVISLLEV